MKNTIIFWGYRDWANQIYENVRDTVFLEEDKIKTLKLKYKFIHIDNNKDLEKNLNELNPKFIFFVGWSSIVKDEIVDKYQCICLHPSPLPQYRGGSPIQHQIINGETKSAVTLFEMSKSGIDKGDILFQKEISYFAVREPRVWFMPNIFLTDDGIPYIYEINPRIAGSIITGSTDATTYFCNLETISFLVREVR